MSVEEIEFTIDVSGGHTWARIAVAGELDLVTTPELCRALDQERVRGRPTVLDLSQVSFLDSTGLTAVLRAMQFAQEDSWDFSISADLSDATVRTARVAGVLPLLPLVEE
jgi:anti-sigma B factor antagonist